MALGGLTCYIGSDTTELFVERCFGFCSMRISRSGNEEATYGCQNYIGYASYSHMCQVVGEKDENHVVIYSANGTIYHKYCCNTPLCNAKANYIPFEHRRDATEAYIFEESPDFLSIDRFCVSAIIIIIITAICWPYWYHWYWKPRMVQQINSHMNEPIEQALVLLEEPPPMEVFQLNDDGVSGKLTFLDLCRTLAARDEPRETRNPTPAREVDQTLRVKEIELQATELGHNVQMASRRVMMQYDTLLESLLEHGPYEYPWKPAGLIDVFDRAKAYFEQDNTLLKISFPVVVIGDIRGQYVDLHRWLQATGIPPRKKLLFLGGVVDPQVDSSLDCLALIAALKMEHPADVFLLRGMGEVTVEFASRFGARSDNAIQSAANRMCSFLPLAAKIGNLALAVHSGICHDMTNLNCFEQIRRPLTAESLDSIARSVIYGVPTGLIKMYRYDQEQSVYYFGINAIQRICRDTGVRLIIRSRSALDNGSLWISGQQMVSLWSAPGCFCQKASILYIDETFDVVLLTMTPQDSSARDAKEKEENTKRKKRVGLRAEEQTSGMHRRLPASRNTSRIAPLSM